MKENYAKYLLIISIIIILTLVFGIFIYQYNKNKPSDVSHLQPFVFYYSKSNDTLFFKNNNYSSDYIKDYSKFKEFIDGFNTMLEDKEDSNYDANSRAVTNIKNTYKSDYFEENSLLVLALRSDEGKKIKTKLLSADVRSKIAKIKCNFEEENGGIKDKYQYNLYFIPVPHKDILNTKLYFPNAKYLNNE